MEDAKPQTIMANNNPPQDQAAELPPPPTPPPCRASTSQVRDGSQEECHCPSCSPEPAGDAFVPRSAIDPTRRIVRARRPPATPNNALPTAVNSINNDGDTSPSVVGASSPANAGTPNARDTSSNLSGAIGFLQQLNGSETSNPAPTAATASGVNAADNGGGTNNHATPAAVEQEEEEEQQIIPELDNEEEEEEEEDDDDDRPRHMPLFQDFLNHMSEMASRRASRRPREILSKKIRPDDDDDEESEEDNNYNGETCTRCAACFRSDNPSHKWRRLVTLPCCGTNGREQNSSTRFCAACILKVAVTRPHSSNTSEYRFYDDEPEQYPVRKFYNKSLQTDSRRFCECPRCRSILLVKIKGVKPAVLEDSDDDSSEGGCDCSDCEAERENRKSDVKTAKSISIHVPTFKAKCWFVGRQRGVAKLLWNVSRLHHNFIPYEALGGDDEKSNILRLTSWGILEKRNVGKKNNLTIYQIDKKNQTKLVKFFRLPKDISEKDSKSEANLFQELSALLGYAAWRHLRDEYRIDRSLRIMNRFFFLGLSYGDYLPPLPLSWWQEQVVTALIVFSVSLVAQFVCVLAVYALIFCGVGLSVCYVLRRSTNIKKSWWQIILVAYLSYRVNQFFYSNPYLSWNVLIVPKAAQGVKKLLWG